MTNSQYNKIDKFVTLYQEHACSSKITLAGFKEKMHEKKQGLKQKPYTQRKPAVRIYRLIFLALTLLFVILGGIMYSKSMIWTYFLIFGETYSLRSLIYLACFVGAVTSFWIAASLRAEKEAVFQLYNQAKDRLKMVYQRRRINFELKAFLALGDELRRAREVSHSYREILHKLRDQKDEALHLVREVGLTPDLEESEREELYNEALQELHNTLSNIVATF